MTNRFVAIDVHEGDAFYLQVQDPEQPPFSVLVDGGKNTNMPFHKQFRAAVGTPGVDVMLCTHSDNDHVLGLIDFLKNGLKATELWLPDQWFELTQFMVNDPIQCVRGVIDDIATKKVEDLKRENSISVQDIEDPDAYFRDQFTSAIRHYRRLRTARPSLPDEGLLIHQGLRRLEHQFQQQQWNETKTFYLSIVLSIITRASDLVDLAVSKKVQLRWFALNATHPSGGNAHLKPFNCEEVPRNWCASKKKPIPDPESKGINERSLVFFSPGVPGQRPTVLFCGDSNFEFLDPVNPVPWMSHMLITTPHHGSGELQNERLSEEYRDHIKANGNVPTVWVRSDVNHSQKKKIVRPAQWFTQLPKQARRYCTICNHEKGPHRCLHFVLDSKQRWTPDKSKPIPPRCTCTPAPPKPVSTPSKKKSKKSSSSQV